MIPHLAPAVWHLFYVAIDTGFALSVGFTAACASLWLDRHYARAVEDGAGDLSDLGEMLNHNGRAFDATQQK